MFTHLYFPLVPKATAVNFPANGRPYTSGMRAMSQSVIKRQKISQGEAPNPVVFVATKDTRYAWTIHMVKFNFTRFKKTEISTLVTNPHSGVLLPPGL